MVKCDIVSIELFKVLLEETAMTKPSPIKYVSSFLLDPTVITKDNLDELVDTGMYRWDNDHRYLVAQDR